MADLVTRGALSKLTRIVVAKESEDPGIVSCRDQRTRRSREVCFRVTCRCRLVALVGRDLNVRKVAASQRQLLARAAFIQEKSPLLGPDVWLGVSQRTLVRLILIVAAITKYRMLPLHLRPSNKPSSLRRP